MYTLRKLCFSIAAAVVLCCSSVTTAQAGTVTFAARATFNAATTATTIVNFDGIVAPGTALADPLPSFTSAGVTFTTPGNQLYIVDTGYFGFYQFAGAGGGVLSSSNGSSTKMMNIVLPGPVTAVGFDTNNFSFSTDNLTITAVLSNGDVTSFTATPGGGFFGFTTTPAILSLTMTGTVASIGGGGFNIDNFTFGQAHGDPTTVPEPATMMLLGTGLLGAAASVRRKRRAGR